MKNFIKNILISLWSPFKPNKNQFFCPDKKIIPIWEEYLDAIRKKGLSVGAKIIVEAKNVPAGLGEPVYSKLDSDLASAMISINAVKAVEIGITGKFVTHMLRRQSKMDGGLARYIS